MKGWFSPSLFATEKPQGTLIPKCGACKLYKACQSPKMAPSGAGERGILIVGEAPGADEDAQGRQFVGRSGRLLRKMLREARIDLARDCRTTNALACRPPWNMLDDKRKIAYCRPAVLSEIRDNPPSVIILLGAAAIESVIGHLWKEETGGTKRWMGYKIPCTEPNAWICPTLHPAYVLRAKPTERDLYERVFLSHLQAAAALAGSHPWDSPPDYQSRVEILFDTDLAAIRLDEITATNVPIAFDYETDRLKPDRKNASIICAAVCAGEDRAIAFPWHGKAVKAMKRLLESECPKIGANMKFEDRWSDRMGIKVRNWVWDTMVMSHVIDSRKAITGLKFQAFVHLGVGDYDSRLKPWIRAKGGGNAPNMLREVDMGQLCLYNGQDALYTYLIAMKQAAILGMEGRFQ